MARVNKIKISILTGIRKKETPSKKTIKNKSERPKSSPTSSPQKPVKNIIPETEEKNPDNLIPKTKRPAKKQGYRDEFLKTFKQLTLYHRPWDVWKDFIVMLACALTNPVDKEHFDERERRYLKIIKQYNKREQNLFPELAAYTIMALDENPEQDFLGSIFMELRLGNEHNGQFFTPYHVSELMADICLGDIVEQVKDKGFVTINDPCCGGGAMLIAALNKARKELKKENLNFQNHVLIVAQDIDETVALMCYIQLSLLGVAGYIKVGNTLTEPMSDSDSLKNYWFTPMYYSDVWQFRRIFHELDLIERRKKV